MLVVGEPPLIDINKAKLTSCSLVVKSNQLQLIAACKLYLQSITWSWWQSLQLNCAHLVIAVVPRADGRYQQGNDCPGMLAQSRLTALMHSGDCGPLEHSITLTWPEQSL